MLTTIILRYLGTLLQFVVLAVIARTVSTDDYGLYMLCLSVTFSYYYVLGIGSSESALAKISSQLAVGNTEDIGRIVGSVLGLTICCGIALLLASAMIAIFQPWSAISNAAAIFVLVFLTANGLIFNLSQLLLGLGHTSLGSFFFYPAINLTLLFSTVPAALVLDDTTFAKLCVVSGLGASVAATAALITFIRLTAKHQLSWSRAEAFSLIRQGIGLTAVRILHVSSFWIPTMITGFLLSPTLAGTMGTAGRLAIAVSAVIAATRFVIRPAINRALARGEVTYLKNVMRSVALITTAAGVLAIIANELFGAQVVGFFFGPELRTVAPILTVLLLSVCAEAIFGPVDELLKASGQQKTVAWIYAVGVPTFLVSSVVVAPFGLIWIAWLQVAYVLGIFLSMNLVVNRQFGFMIFPHWSALRDLRRLT